MGEEKRKVQSMKLHLGCYKRKIHGYVNVDVRADVEPDLVDDAFILKNINPDSVDVIYASHVLEHGKQAEVEAALKRWYEVLKVGGVVRIAVPDLEAVFDYYRTTKNLKELKAFIYGSQKHPYDYHYIGWDFDSLKSDLESVGFRNVRRYDWRDTDHFYIDDYSQCYLPSISYKTRNSKTDEIGGKLLSLNVEATK